MSEKKYEIRQNSDGTHWLFDNEYDSVLMITHNIASLLDVCTVLNEQNRKIKKLEQENKALESNVEWFAHQLEKHYTLYSDDFLETLETIEGEETVEKIRERQNEIIKILKKE